MDSVSKYKIVEKIIQTDDDTLLGEIESLLNLSQHNFWNDITTEVKNAINQAKAELDRGEGIPHSDVMAEINKRFLKID
jgi:hypothetical protein